MDPKEEGAAPAAQTDVELEDGASEGAVRYTAISEEDVASPLAPYPDPLEPPLDPAVAREIERQSEAGGSKKKSRVASWFGRRAKKVVTKLYESRADDIEERARRAVGSAYRDQADDLQERAVRAMRQAIRDESQTIRETIEHAVEIKKREVRLSLIVLVAASLTYLALWWLTK